MKRSNPIRATFLVFLVLALIVCGLCFACGLGSQLIELVAKGTVEGTVQDKYIKRYNDADYFHVVVLKSDGQSEVFQNRDFAPLRKFRSADLQASLKVGSRYRFTVVGWRWPLLSAFRNIVKAEPLP